MKITIYADGSYESVSAAKPKNLSEHQQRVKALKRDVSLATKIAAQQKRLETLKDSLAKLKAGTKTASAKTRIEAARERIKGVRETIKTLKGDLTTPLNAKLERANAQLTKAQQAKADHGSKHLPRNQKTSRPGDAAKVRRSEQKTAARRKAKAEAPSGAEKFAQIRRFETDIRTLKKIDTLTRQQEAAKAAGKSEKSKALSEQIKAWKKTLSSPKQTIASATQAIRKLKSSKTSRQ